MTTCSICSCQLKTSPDDEGKIGVSIGDRWFCNECHEVFLFAGDLEGVDEHIEDVPKVEEKPKVEKTVTSSGSVTCVRCKEKMGLRDIKCVSCGCPNPLMGKKKKTRKR